MSQMQTHNAVVRVTSCSAESYKTGDRPIFWRTDHCPQFISIRTRDHCGHSSCPQMLRECHRTRQSQYRADTAADNIFFPFRVQALYSKGEGGSQGGLVCLWCHVGDTWRPLKPLASRFVPTTSIHIFHGISLKPCWHFMNHNQVRFDDDWSQILALNY